MTPELLHILFWAAGLGIGWYVRHVTHTSASPAIPSPNAPLILPNGLQVPPEVMTALAALIHTEQQRAGHSRLVDLLALALPPGAPSPLAVAPSK